MEKQIAEAADFLTTRLEGRPQVGLITGTGLGSVTQRFSEKGRLPYHQIPHFPRSTAPGHEGSLILCDVRGTSVLAMAGRFHLYEGYTGREVSFPVRVMARLGVKTLLISSAAGGLNPAFHRGDLMMVTDHINLTGSNPLVGPNLDDFGPRFPDMAEVYDPGLKGIARRCAKEAGIPLREGVFVGITGPSLETPAETRFLRMIGADAVGMSTVTEGIAGVHSGLRIGAILVITNVNLPDRMKQIAIEEVIRAAQEAGPVLGGLWERIIPQLPSH